MSKMTSSQRSAAAKKGWRTRKALWVTGPYRCLSCGVYHLPTSKIGKAHRRGVRMPLNRPAHPW